jgi:hypothetical protein
MRMAFFDLFKNSIDTLFKIPCNYEHTFYSVIYFSFDNII